MRQPPIYLVGTDGLRRMEPVKPEIEADAQALIEAHPDLISEEDGDLLLLKREQASDGGFLDHLFVTRAGVPVLVEVKRSENAEIRRRIVAQMLDYAANNWATWQEGQAERLFREARIATGEDPDAILETFIEGEASAFWAEVDQNMRDGKMTLLFVADEIPLELRRIVEFLNDQGMRATVQAVALNYFEAADGTLALAPQRYGQTEQIIARRSASEPLEPISIPDWLTKHVDTDDRVRGANLWLELIGELGATPAVTDRQGSISAAVQGTDGTTVFPLFFRAPGRVEICFMYNQRRGALRDPDVRQQFLDRFTDAVGELSTDKLTGWPAFPAERLLDDDTTTRFRAVAKDWLTFCRDPFGNTQT